MRLEQDKKPLKLYLWRIGDRVNLLMSSERYDDTLNYMPYPRATLREIQKTIDDISSLYETYQYRNESISKPKEVLSDFSPKALEAKLVLSFKFIPFSFVVFAPSFIYFSVFFKIKRNRKKNISSVKSKRLKYTQKFLQRNYCVCYI